MAKLRAKQTFPWSLLLGLVLVSTQTVSAEEAYMPEPYVKLEHPEWSRDAVIYQINTRQFTPEGTFAAAEKQLPRLKDLGVDILWLMPVQEIGLKNRKGRLGSPYSIRDYRSVNAEYGDLDSLKHFVSTAHKLGLHVILDWVANHTAWDNPLTEQHPEWYARDWKNEFHSPAWTDWSDVIELDYSQPGLRRYMTETMKWWVTEVGMDGFRCDVAGFVPLDFWNRLRAELDAIRPVFMLAEWEQRDVHARAFDMTYEWGFYNTLHNIAQGKANATALVFHYYEKNNSWPFDAMRMVFVSNHDKNAWDGTQFEAFGNALENAIVLSFVSEGVPLIYNGQEAGNPKRLNFFDRDPIEWREHPVGELYRRLIVLKKKTPALWNGRWGADMVQITNSAPASVFSFVRAREDSKVFAVFNFSAQPKNVTFSEALYQGDYRDFTTGEAQSLGEDFSLDMPAWSYRVFTR
jgi:glycosidase